MPWFFNCVYNYNQLASSLIEEIFNKRKYSKVALISDNSYDSGSASSCLINQLISSGKPDPLHISYDDAIRNFNTVSQKIKSGRTECIILFVTAPESLHIIQKMKDSGLNMPVFGSLAQLDENKIHPQDLKIYKNVVFISSGITSGYAGYSFCNDFKNAYGSLPGAVAAHAYDGMNILIEAIRRAGFERENLQKAISGIRYDGATGLIRFDEHGNRMGIPGLVEFKNGIPVLVAE